MKLIKFTQSSIFSTIIALILAGCSGGNVRTDLDNPNKGTIHICVDEAFKPVIDSEIQVYEALHPGTNIIAEYKPEAECFEDLNKDSTRMIIVTRPLTTKEERYYHEKLTYYPHISKVAYGALAVIVNEKADDSVFYMASLRSILNGTVGGDKKIVFDGVEGSSALRYIEDSLLQDKPIDSSRVFGVNGSKAVIEAVEARKDLIGFVGVSWVGNPEDTTQLSFLDQIAIAAIQCDCPQKEFVKPYQVNILRKTYPMVRGLYYVLKENYTGLGSGFGNFLESERGQLIFKRAYLGPAKMNFYVRTMILSQ